MLNSPFGWKDLGLTWHSEDVCRVRAVLGEHHIPTRMPCDDMYFYSPFHLPRPDHKWRIRVRRQDWQRAVSLLAREGLAIPALSAAAEKRPDPQQPLIRWESGNWIIYIGRTCSLPPANSTR